MHRTAARARSRARVECLDRREIRGLDDAGLDLVDATSSPHVQNHATASRTAGSDFNRIWTFSPSGNNRLGTHAGTYTVSPGSSVIAG